MINLTTGTLSFIFALLLYFITLRRNPNLAKLPPGPAGVPVLGNLLHLMTGTPWLTFKEWKKQYGSIVYINLAGQHAIILGDMKVAGDLLDRRATIYSGRTKTIVSQILTGGLVLPFMQYTQERWKRMWRGSYEALSKNVARTYYPFQETESVLLASQLMNTPAEYDSHLQRASNSLVLSMVYGLPPVSSSSDPTVINVCAFTQELAKSGVPGQYLVEYFTWMRFLPRWMCSWRREAEGWYARTAELADKLLEGVDKRMNEGTQKPCFVSTLLEDKKSTFTRLESTWMALTLFAGGSESISTQLAWFILAMVLHPSVQKEAHEEIDRVVGRDRLPTFQDHDKLTYIRAIVREIMRWRSVAPLGIPHRLENDDWYNGYFIPKDTICIANTWVMNHDPDIYGPDAEDFRPGRYLDSKTGGLVSIVDGREEGHASFGFGRRKVILRRACVGRHVANNSMFIQMACILWAFEIAPIMDSSGKVDLPDSMEFDEKGLTVHPKAFKCNISPRFEGAEKVVGHTMEVLGLQNCLE
ncbi:cytochrome P450 [Cyathus striatus]|nr:cytochrome P450 [Cyathus striatus]